MLKILIFFALYLTGKNVALIIKSSETVTNLPDLRFQRKAALRLPNNILHLIYLKSDYKQLPAFNSCVKRQKQ